MEPVIAKVRRYLKNYDTHAIRVSLAQSIISTKTIKFPLYIPLDNRTQTTGVILCEHVKALDLNARPHTVVEQLPKEILTKVINVVFSEIEQI